MNKLGTILNNSNDKLSYFSLVFGNKPFENCFDFSLSPNKYLEFLRFIKNSEKWELISKKNLKIFYYYDLKLTVDDKGNHNLEKEIVNNYHDLLNKNNQGIRLINYTKIENMDINIFPGLDKIHDIRKVREIIFKKDNVFIKFLVINHSNKEITFESFVYTSNKYSSNLFKQLPKLFNFFKLKNLVNYHITEMNNVDKLSISVL